VHAILRARIVLVTTLLLSGCGAVGFVYNNAPAFVASKFDDAFALDDAQSARLDNSLQQFFAWHRQQELTRYRELLQQAAVKVADGLTAPEVLELTASLRDAWQRSLARAIDDLGDLALTLTPQQIAHFEQYFRDESKEQQDYLQMSAQQREIYRAKRGVDRLQDWFGSFDELQREKISLRLQRLPDAYSARIRYREARQQALLRALRAAPAEGLTREQLKFILLDPASDYARAYEPERSAYWQAYAQAIEEISGWLSKAQLQHAVERLQYYADIADGLARES
jgi:hypothetical protein